MKFVRAMKKADTVLSWGLKGIAVTLCLLIAFVLLGRVIIRFVVDGRIDGVVGGDYRADDGVDDLVHGDTAVSQRGALPRGASGKEILR